MDWRWVVLWMLTPLVFSVSARIVDGSLNTVSLYFTGTSTDPGTWYLDAVDENPDVGIEICDVGQKYVGAAYAINVQGTWKYVLITYKSDTEPLSYTSLTSSPGCYYTSPADLTFSPITLTTTPPVYFAAFPGRVYVAYEDSSTPSTLSNFVLASGYLRGSYDVRRSYDQSTNTISVETPTITFQTSSGSFSKSASDSTFGVSNDRRMVVGICDDEFGMTCNSGVIVPVEGNFPLSLDAGVSPVNDQYTYTKYVVVNGFGYPICIGANLKISITSLSPNPIYYGQTLEVSFKIQNYRDTPYEIYGGNVAVTTDFVVHVKIYNSSNPSQVVFEKDIQISDDFNPGDSRTYSFNWTAKAHSGWYVIEFTVDYGDIIAECNEADNKDSRTFELKPIVIPEIYINGNKTDEFPYAGIPYNLTMYLKNSDNVSLDHATVRIVEENGLDVFVPTQIYNLSSNESFATKVKKIVELKSNGTGWLKITVIPTGNPLYAPEYKYINFSGYVGNYSMYFEGEDKNGEKFVFLINGSITDRYYFKVRDYWSYSEESTYNLLPNLESFVKAIMNMIYKVFANFWLAMQGW